MAESARVVSATRDIAAGVQQIFDLIADPSRQPSWDAKDNLAVAEPGRRVHRVGDVVTMTPTLGGVRHNHVVEFEEGRRIAWRPSEPGKLPPDDLWRWELAPVSETCTTVIHTYDWTALNDPDRLGRAQATTAQWVASVDRPARRGCRKRRPISRVRPVRSRYGSPVFRK